MQQTFFMRSAYDSNPLKINPARWLTRDALLATQWLSPMQLGNIHRVTLSGMCILADHAMPVGTAIRISYGAGYLSGKVAHSLQTAEGSLVAVRFVDDDDVQPDHYRTSPRTSQP